MFLWHYESPPCSLTERPKTVCALDAVPNFAPWKDTKKAASCEVQPSQGSRPIIGVKQRDHQVVDRLPVQEHVWGMCSGCCIGPSATGWTKKESRGGSSAFRNW